MANRRNISAALDSVEDLLSPKHIEELDRHYRKNRDILSHVKEESHIKYNEKIGVHLTARRIVRIACDSPEYSYHFSSYDDLEDTERSLAETYVGLRTIDNTWSDNTWSDNQDSPQKIQENHQYRKLVDAHTTAFQLIKQLPIDRDLDELSSMDIAMVSIAISSASSVYIDDPSIQLSLASFVYVLLMDIKRERENNM